MDCSEETNNVEHNGKREVSTFRTIIPQILASTAKNLLLIDLGLSVAFPTIVIPALRGTIQGDSSETLRFTDDEASWFGSIIYICQPIGSLLSGVVADSLGRKKAMIIVNIPFAAGWLVLYFANSLALLFIGQLLLGVAVGLLEAPILTYIGEICQPSIRGILISFFGVSLTLGNFLSYMFGSITTWRITAIICLVVPIVTATALSFVPETPMWLLSKNRKEDALKSLQWLRGWVPPKNVEDEFEEMKNYNENFNKCISCFKANITCDHPPATFVQKLKELTRKGTIKAFVVVLGLFLFAQFNGILAMSPFMVQIFKAYKVPIDPSMATVYFGVVSFFANIACMGSVRILGKRKISLIGFCGSTLCALALGVYAELTFPVYYNSFDSNDELDIQTSVFPLIIFYMYNFLTNFGIYSVPWIILSEVFAFKVRGIATGTSAAINYLFYFIGTKTYLDLDKGLALNGTMWFYTAVNLIGTVFVFFVLPETENRTLEDVEAHFADNSKKIWDLNIQKSNNLENDCNKIFKEDKAEINLNIYDNKAFTE